MGDEVKPGDTARVTDQPTQAQLDALLDALVRLHAGVDQVRKQLTSGGVFAPEDADLWRALNAIGSAHKKARQRRAS